MKLLVAELVKELILLDRLFVTVFTRAVLGRNPNHFNPATASHLIALRSFNVVHN